MLHNVGILKCMLFHQRTQIQLFLSLPTKRYPFSNRRYHRSLPPSPAAPATACALNARHDAAPRGGLWPAAHPIWELRAGQFIQRKLGGPLTSIGVAVHPNLVHPKVERMQCRTPFDGMVIHWVTPHDDDGWNRIAVFDGAHTRQVRGAPGLFVQEPKL